MTKTKTKTQSATRTVVGLAIAGAVLASAAAGLAGINFRKAKLHERINAFPYQTVGYTPGYTPGYIPGNVPGYSVPGYVPGYGTFMKLSPADFVKERTLWIKNLREKFRF
ncbi:MAG: hypothetical protein NUV56_02550 [Candidatus Uhrbacteria bacterium]|nr:hypothetical protein [Candidatus Uhrbacteria bacterium]